MVYNLNNGVKIAELYSNLDKDEIAKIEDAAKDGFTTQELKSLEEDGIDTSLIKKNSAKGTTKETKTDNDVASRAQEIKEKYCKNIKGGADDPYTTSNPELTALNTAMDDGLIAELGQEGFSKTQIVNIINQAFPTIGISAKGDDGSYSRPYGHGSDAAKIYSRFSSQLLAATGEDSEEIKAARAKLAALNIQIADNNHSMQVLSVTIEALQDEVEDQIKEAIDESEDIAEEQKDAAKQAVNKRLNEYTSKNGEMSYEEFQSAVSGDLSGIQTKSGRQLSNVVISLMDANHKMNLLKNYVSEMSDLQNMNQDLSSQATAAKSELDTLIKESIENASEADPQAECTDPIGFSTDSARFDFFVDRDNNGDITNESEFLGATDGFSEMKKLDNDSNGIVTAQELDKAGVKVIKTNKDGTQEILNASDVFKDVNDGIDLSSYKSANEDIGNGNTLLGTFSAKMNGAQMEGYQTLDSQEWLDKNYQFTDESDGVGRFAQDSDGVEEALDFSEKINIFTMKNEQLETNLKKAWSQYGFDEETIDRVTSAQNSSAKAKGKAISEKFEEIARQEEEKVEWTQEDEQAALEKQKEQEESDENKKKLEDQEE